MTKAIPSTRQVYHPTLNTTNASSSSPPPPPPPPSSQFEAIRAQFSSTKSNRSTNIYQNIIGDSGATGIFIRESDKAIVDNQIADSSIQINFPNNTSAISIATGTYLMKMCNQCRQPYFQMSHYVSLLLD
jgi:hypothetical protein